MIFTTLINDNGKDIFNIVSPLAIDFLNKIIKFLILKIIIDYLFIFTISITLIAYFLCDRISHISVIKYIFEYTSTLFTLDAPIYLQMKKCDERLSVH